MAIVGMDSFNRYQSVGDFGQTTNCPITWATTTDAGLITFPSPSAFGSGQYLEMATGAALTATFSEIEATLICGFGLKPSGGCLLHIHLVDLTTGAANVGTTQAQIIIDTTAGTVQVLDKSGLGIFTSTDGVYNTDGWSYFNFNLAVSAIQGLFGLAIDGATICELAAQNFKEGASTWNGIVFNVLSGTCGISDFLFQNINNPVAGFLSSYTLLGPAYVVPINPIADGTENDWNPSTAGSPNWEMIKGPQSGGGTSISVTQSFTGSEEELYAFEPVVSPIPFIGAVQAVGLYSNQGTSPAAMSHAFDIGSNVSGVSFTVPAGTTEQYYSTLSEVEPGYNGNWSADVINGMTVGPAVGPNAASGVVSNGNTLFSTSGSNAGGIGDSFEIDAVPFQALGVIFNYSVTGTLISYPLGPIGGGPEIKIDTGSAGDNFIIATIDLYNTAVDPNPPNPNPDNITNLQDVLFQIVDAPLPTDNFSLGIDHAVGSTLSFTCSGWAIATNLQYNGAAGTFSGQYGDAVLVDTVNGTRTYHNVRMGPYEQLEYCYTTAYFKNYINGATWDFTVEEAVPAPAQVMVCELFFLECLVFADIYGSGGVGGLTLPIFPTLAGLAFPVLRRFIFNNVVNTGASGAEVRIGFNPNPLWEWELEFSYLPDEQANGTTATDYKTLVGFCLRVKGNLLPFLFKDEDDCYTPVQTPSGVGDGVTKSFTMYRAFGLNDNNGSEPIGFWDETQPLTVFVAGEPQDPSLYSINTATPLAQQIVFADAPASGSQITWIGGYYFVCRLGEEKQDFSKTMEKLWETSKLVIHSLRNANT